MKQNKLLSLSLSLTFQRTFFLLFSLLYLLMPLGFESQTSSQTKCQPNSSFNLFPPHTFSSGYICARMRFNVVIPTFNEGSCIEACLRSIQEANSSSTPLHQVSITISDGGSFDATTHIASAWGATVLGKAPSPHRGRGAQLNHAVRHILSKDNNRDSILWIQN